MSVKMKLLTNIFHRTLVVFTPTFITNDLINKTACFFVICLMTHSWCCEPPTREVHSSWSNCSFRFPAANKSLHTVSKCSRDELNAAQLGHQTTEKVFKMQPHLVRALLVWIPVRIRFDSVCTRMSTRLHDANRIKRKVARTASCNMPTVCICLQCRQRDNTTSNMPVTWRSSTDC